MTFRRLLILEACIIVVLMLVCWALAWFVAWWAGMSALSALMLFVEYRVLDSLVRRVRQG